MGTRQIVIDVPEKVLLVERTDEATFAREVRIELAGMPRVEFLLTLGRYRVCAFEAELRELKAGNGWIGSLRDWPEGFAVEGASWLC